MRVLLDTHVWVWWLTGDPALSDRERTLFDRAAGAQQVFLSAISLWEVQMLHSKNRLSLPLPFGDWLRRASAPGLLRILPLDADVVIALDRLPRRFHGDPADRLIVATARAHRLVLATRNVLIRSSRAVRLWRADHRGPARRHRELLALRGQVRWEGDLAAMRADRTRRKP